MMIKKSREQGVVLLSCLVLVVLILSLLRFSLSSSMMSEQRAGIDIEISSAKKAATDALVEVQKAIMLCPTGQNCDTVDQRKTAVSYWYHAVDLKTGDVKLNPMPVGFFYRGRNSASLPSGCKKLWQCVNWQVKGKTVKVNNTNFTPANLMSNGAIRAQYVVEFFKGEDFGLDDARATIYRVTVMGFGRVNKADAAATNYMLQSTYILGTRVLVNK